MEINYLKTLFDTVKENLVKNTIHDNFKDDKLVLPVYPREHIQV